MRVFYHPAVLLLLVGCIQQTPEESLISESSDGAYRVSILELRGRMDRNFEIWLERKSDGFKTNIFRSPDEGRPIGTERIIWCRHHSQFVLVGQHFFVEDSPGIPIETLYLLYDIPSGKLWCNASQAAGPRFTRTNLYTGCWDGSYENDVSRKKQ